MKHGCEAASRLRVFFVGRLELFHETREQFGALGFTGGRVVIHEIAAAAAKYFAHRRWCEIGRLRLDVICAEQIKNLLRIAKDAAVKWIDEERQVVRKAPDDEVARQADRLEFECD